MGKDFLYRVVLQYILNRAILHANDFFLKNYLREGYINYQSFNARFEPES
jgi:hypothetical protein